jgi:hypothetical protein
MRHTLNKIISWKLESKTCGWFFSDVEFVLACDVLYQLLEW